MLVADGVAPGDDIYEVEEEDEPDHVSGEPRSRTVRLTLLDPSAPSRSLVRYLLAGIRGCRLVYGGYTEQLVPRPEEDQQSWDPEYDARVDVVFCEAVRARAAEDHARLM